MGKIRDRKRDIKKFQNARAMYTVGGENIRGESQKPRIIKGNWV